MINRYRHIFFDWDSTLWNFSVNSEKALSVLFHDYDFEKFFPDFKTFHTIYKGKNAELWEDYALGKIKREFLETERFEYPFRSIGVSPDAAREQIQALKTDYLELLAGQTVLNDGAKEVLEYFKNKGCKLYVISNGFSCVQHLKIERSGLKDYFTKIFLSEDIKEHKPQRAFFDYMLKSSNARKVESLVVGDNFTADIAGAHNAGIDQAYYAPDYDGAPLPFQPTYIISSLRELIIN
ncbi:MAG: YjjG family noncanonical pyrimidine nucleotidase [Paludibacteraceae bacterium]|nr:YjjG family noncanonical pyrimidine nucleotidase [Paludibacteraceae bacterium]